MKIRVEIIDDNGEIVADHEADACQPSMWRAQSGQRFVGKMPQTSDQKNTGTYELFGITFQPHTRVERPNGWTTPAPSPNNGQLNGPPTPQSSGFQPAQKSYPWGPSSPTKATAPPSPGFAPTRGL